MLCVLRWLVTHAASKTELAQYKAASHPPHPREHAEDLLQDCTLRVICACPSAAYIVCLLSVHVCVHCAADA